MSQISDKGLIVAVGATLTLGLGIFGYNAEQSRQDKLGECLKSSTPEVCKPLTDDENFLYRLAGWALLGTGISAIYMDGYKMPRQPKAPTVVVEMEGRREEPGKLSDHAPGVISN